MLDLTAEMSFSGQPKKKYTFPDLLENSRAYNQVNALCLFLTKETQLKIFFRALYCYVGSVLLQGANINTICIDHKKWALRAVSFRINSGILSFLQDQGLLSFLLFHVKNSEKSNFDTTRTINHQMPYIVGYITTYPYTTHSSSYFVPIGTTERPLRYNILIYTRFEYES